MKEADAKEIRIEGKFQKFYFLSSNIFDEYILGTFKKFDERNLGVVHKLSISTFRDF